MGHSWLNGIGNILEPTGRQTFQQHEISQWGDVVLTCFHSERLISGKTMQETIVIECC